MAISTDSVRLSRFVVDSRFAEGAEIATQFLHRGVAVTKVTGDLSDLWYDHLDPQWKDGPKAMAGVTTREGLFVLEALAADYRMRVVYRGEHAAPRDGLVLHTMSGPKSLITAATSKAGASNWRYRLGHAMVRCPLGAQPATTISLETMADPGSLRKVSLFSWIMVPRSVVTLITV
jgi:hypothetical protein